MTDSPSGIQRQSLTDRGRDRQSDRARVVVAVECH